VSDSNTATIATTPRSACSFALVLSEYLLLTIAFWQHLDKLYLMASQGRAAFRKSREAFRTLRHMGATRLTDKKHVDRDPARPSDRVMACLVAEFDCPQL
jgi:hypothetical protein